jgi:hypothetical protein
MDDVPVNARTDLIEQPLVSVVFAKHPLDDGGAFIIVGCTEGRGGDVGIIGVEGAQGGASAGADAV